MFYVNYISVELGGKFFWRKGNLDTQKMLWDHGRINWSYVNRKPRNTKDWQPPPEAKVCVRQFWVFCKNRTYWYLDCEFLAWTVRECMYVVLSHQLPVLCYSSHRKLHANGEHYNLEIQSTLQLCKIIFSLWGCMNVKKGVVRHIP